MHRSWEIWCLKHFLMSNIAETFIQSLYNNVYVQYYGFVCNVFVFSNCTNKKKIFKKLHNFNVMLSDVMLSVVNINIF